jgi:tetratricopeptide (TPR) repeat protein
MVVWGVAELAEIHKPNLRASAAAIGVVMAVLSLLTWRQIGTWRSSYDLWSHALQVTTNNYMAEDYVGTSLLLKGFEEKGQRYSEEARVHFQNAARINPGDAISHLNLGADFQEHGKLREAIQQYLIVLQLTSDPELVKKTLIDLGVAYEQSGDYVRAGEYDRAVLKMDPHNRAVFANLGKLGMEERIQQLAAAASAKPSGQAYLQLGQLQQAAGHPVEARGSYQEALRMSPRFEAAQEALNSLNGSDQR